MDTAHVLLNIAGLQIDFCTRFPDYARRRCGRYLASGAATDACPAATDADSAIRLEATAENLLLADRDGVGPMEAELYAITIPFSELCPSLGRLMTHGVAIECDGKAFIFTAESGVGKSTHAFLWQKYLGEDRVRVINGDKPVLWFRQDGEILACGSPWSGKERLDANVQVPLRGICLLTRLEDAPGFGTAVNAPYIVPASREEAFDFLMHQVFIPQSAQGRIATLGMIEKLYEQVPVYHLFITKSLECAKVSSECLLKTSDL